MPPPLPAPHGADDVLEDGWPALDVAVTFSMERLPDVPGLYPEGIPQGEDAAASDSTTTGSRRSLRMQQRVLQQSSGRGSSSGSGNGIPSPPRPPRPPVPSLLLSSTVATWLDVFAEIAAVQLQSFLDPSGTRGVVVRTLAQQAQVPATANSATGSLLVSVPVTATLVARVSYPNGVSTVIASSLGTFLADPRAAFSNELLAVYSVRSIQAVQAPQQAPASTPAPVLQPITPISSTPLPAAAAPGLQEPRSASPTSQAPEDKNSDSGMIIGIAVAVPLAVIALAVIGGFVYYKKYYMKPSRYTQAHLKHDSLISSECIMDLGSMTSMPHQAAGKHMKSLGDSMNQSQSLPAQGSAGGSESGSKPQHGIGAHSNVEEGCETEALGSDPSRPSGSALYLPMAMGAAGFCSAEPAYPPRHAQIHHRHRMYGMPLLESPITSPVVTPAQQLERATHFDVARQNTAESINAGTFNGGVVMNRRNTAPDIIPAVPEDAVPPIRKYTPMPPTTTRSNSIVLTLPLDNAAGIHEAMPQGAYPLPGMSVQLPAMQQPRAEDEQAHREMSSPFAAAAYSPPQSSLDVTAEAAAAAGAALSVLARAPVYSAQAPPPLARDSPPQSLLAASGISAPLCALPEDLEVSFSSETGSPTRRRAATYSMLLPGVGQVNGSMGHTPGMANARDGNGNGSGLARPAVASLALPVTRPAVGPLGLPRNAARALSLSSPSQVLDIQVDVDAYDLALVNEEVVLQEEQAADMPIA